MALFFIFFFTDLNKSSAGGWADPATGFAIGGYDPVSYFTRRRAVLGQFDYQHSYEGVAWKFENIGNKEAFEKFPHIYSPQFSGYDPYALIQGKLARGLPTLWIIHNDRLYLFDNIINRRLWMDDKSRFIQKGKRVWPNMSKDLVKPIFAN